MNTDSQRGFEWPKADYSRVPYAVFTDPDLYDEEQKRIFRGPVWCYLALEAEVPKPGDHKTTFVGDTPVVVNRGPDGEIRAFINRCAHRGTQLVREPFGNNENYTCVYHHWCYDLAGNLIGVPFQRGIDGQGGMPESFDKTEHPLHMLDVATYRGVIFGTLDPGVEPLEEFLDELSLEYLDRVFRKPIEILGYSRQRIPANWKVYFENLRDPYHAGLLHQFVVTTGIFRNTQAGGTIMDKKKRHEVHYGLMDSDEQSTTSSQYEDLGMYGAEMQLADPSIFEVIDEIGDGKAVAFLSVFPTAVFQQISTSVMTRHIRPRRHNEFELYWTAFGYVDDPPELRHKRLMQTNMMGAAGITSMEDGVVGALIQDAIRREGDSHSVIEMGGIGPIENQDTVITEVPIRGFWSYYCELMGMPVGPA